MWKTCGWRVQILLTTRHRKYFFKRMSRREAAIVVWMFPSRCASLDLHRVARKIDARSPQRHRPSVIAHRFEETIGGRPYLIEVTPVSNRWRAQLLRSPGVPTAMMPFYGRTPDEAAKQLADWLTLAHRRQTPSV
jgi:hypothetical protein